MPLLKSMLIASVIIKSEKRRDAETAGLVYGKYTVARGRVIASVLMPSVYFYNVTSYLN